MNRASAIALSSRRLRRPSGPGPAGQGDHVALRIRFAVLVLGHCPGAHGDAGLVDGLPIAADQRMPPREAAALSDASIGAGPRQPAHLTERIRTHHEAVGYVLGAVRVVRAAAVAELQQPAGHAGVAHLARVDVLQLMQAAAPAAVAQRLPLLAGHRRQRRGLPERLHARARPGRPRDAATDVSAPSNSLSRWLRRWLASDEATVAKLIVLPRPSQ